MYLGMTLLLERIWKYILLYRFPRTKTILWFPHCCISGLALFLDYSSHRGLWRRELHPLGQRWRKRNCTVIRCEYELSHLHEQGTKGDRDRLLMAKEGKVISECHECSWRVRKLGDLCRDLLISSTISALLHSRPEKPAGKCCGGHEVSQNVGLGLFHLLPTAMVGRRAKILITCNPITREVILHGVRTFFICKLHLLST